MRLVVEVEGLAEGLEAVRSDLLKRVERVADAMREDVRRQFQEGGDPKWRPLSPRTAAAKFGEGYPRRNRRGEIPDPFVQEGRFGPENVLIKTGALLSSWVDKTDPHHIDRLDGDDLELGSEIEYAVFHQTGTKRMPARPVRVTPEMRQAAFEVFRKE